MFKNAGIKLSIFASLLFVVIAISCILFLLTSSTASGGLTFSLVLLVIITLLSAYVSCLALSAFGDLVEDVRSINLHLSVANKIALKKQNVQTGNKDAATENNQ